MALKQFSQTLLLSLLSVNVSYAFFCPNNFNQIDFGYTMDQVLSQCGKPDKEEMRDAEVTVPQEWDYFIPQSTVVGNAFMQQQGTYKTAFTFDANGKVLNISVNGIGMASTTICGPAITLGTTTAQVKAACGDPGFISKQEVPPMTDMEKAANKITMFIYTTGTTNNVPVTLIFEGERLTGKQ